MGQEEILYYNFKADNLVPVNCGRIINLSEIEIDPIFTPGHTRGSICYSIGDNLFTGDTLFNEGCGACTGPGADPDQMYISLTKLKNMVKPETSIYPGHRYNLPVGRSFKKVLENNIYLHFANREEFTAFRMRKGQGNFLNFL